MEVADPDVCLCARQYSLIDHANALNELFPAVRAKNVSLVIGSSLNAGFISGSPRYNYGKKNHEIPADVIDKRERLRAVAARHGVDLRTAALQFSAAPPRPSRWSSAPAAPSRSAGLELHAGQDPGRFLGRAEAGEAHRAERADARGLRLELLDEGEAYAPAFLLSSG